ncbi:hypothetical protein AAFC00_003059 [Neodothiora populina]|uniref:C2H2-type domain-containing protein n=1 Tax=Neodothiora populina TaxID=2781224 RepID=A0ABR3P948_9PEZI
MAKRQRQDSNVSLHEQDLSSAAAQEIVHPGKYTHLDATPAETTKGSSSQTIQCALPPHKPLLFERYSDYEVHYQKTHVNRCLECNRNFPTEHFLDLHIAENHDPLRAARREQRGEKTYECFVEGCDKVCSTWQKRRMHLVAKHMFPPEYDFFIVNDGIDNRTSMLRPESSYRGRGRSSAATGTAEAVDNNKGRGHGHDAVKMDICGDEGTVPMTQADEDQTTQTTQTESIDQQADDAVINSITGSLAALNFVPKSVTFGRKQGGGLAKS